MLKTLATSLTALLLLAQNAAAQSPELTIETLFDAMRSDAREFIRLDDLSQPQNLSTRRGSQITIAPRSLVRPDGRPAKGPIQIELREMASLGAMLWQNMNYTNEKAILRTNNAIFIGATDADGAVLKLDKGSKITFNLFQQPNKSDNLQIFGAAPQTNPKQTKIRWENYATTNQELVKTNTNSLPNPPKLFNKYYSGQHYRQELLDNIEKLYSPFNYAPLVPQNKRPAPDGYEPFEPPIPSLLDLQPPSREKIQKNSPKTAKESRKAYGQRLDSLYAKEKHIYDSLQADNLLKKQAYEQAQSRYDSLKKAYDQVAKPYERYVDSLVMATIAVFQHYAYDLRVYYYIDWFEEQQKGWTTAFSALKKTNSFDIFGEMRQDSQFSYYFAMEKALKEKKTSLIAQVDAYGKDNIDKIFSALPFTLELMGQDSLFVVLADVPIEFPEHRTSDKDRLIRGMGGKQAFVAAAERFFAKTMPMMGDQIEKSACIKAVNSYFNSPMAGLEETFDIIRQEEVEIFNQYRRRYRELGLRTQLDTVYSVVQSPNLGWICSAEPLTCVPSNCMRFTLQHRAGPTERFFIVMPGIDAVVPLESDGSTINSGDFEFMPRRQPAKLVGIRVVDGQPAIFIAEDNAESLQYTKVIFKDCSAGEAKKLIGAL